MLKWGGLRIDQKLSTPPATPPSTYLYRPIYTYKYLYFHKNKSFERYLNNTVDLHLDGCILTFISAYAPTLGSSDEDKEGLYEQLSEISRKVPAAHWL